MQVSSETLMHLYKHTCPGKVAQHPIHAKLEHGKVRANFQRHYSIEYKMNVTSASKIGTLQSYNYIDHVLTFRVVRICIFILFCFKFFCYLLCHGTFKCLKVKLVTVK